MKYKVIVFDVGDTLIGYEPSQAECWLARLRQIGLPSLPSAAEVSEALKAAEYAQLMKEYLGAPRMPDADFLRMLDLAVLSCVLAAHEAEATLPLLQGIAPSRSQKRVKPEAFDVLNALRSRGQRMGIVSNYPPELRAYLQEAGLAPYFETIIISGEVGVEKPDPRIMQLAMEAMQIQPAECLYVGDHPFDVLCARKAGMDVAWIASPQTQLPEGIGCSETYRIDSLNDLLSL